MTKAGIGLDCGPLDSISLKVAEEELRETPERVAESVAQLRKLLEGNTLILSSRGTQI